MSTTSPSAAPVPLHIAIEAPPPPAPFAPTVIGSAAGPHNRPSPAPKPTGPDWAALGIELRWKDQETSDCAAILSPVLGPATGAEEYTRYAAGAQRRGESVLVVACTGAGERSYNVFSGTVAPGIHLPGAYGQITANPLPNGVRPELADNLDHAEHELGARLLNSPPNTWFGLKLLQAITHSGRAGSAVIAPKPKEAVLRPILVDGLGNPIAGVWVPADRGASAPGKRPGRPARGRPTRPSSTPCRASACRPRTQSCCWRSRYAPRSTRARCTRSWKQKSPAPAARRPDPGPGGQAPRPTWLT
ncbi:hypothetical protein [Kitasatospora purpeofusca]|uniref:hypothetical protein n=1 Tax=Kitasatospora purpeofusca TaxID=67352 RepID=UPI0035DAB5E5